jgi:hypothetical protein
MRIMFEKTYQARCEAAWKEGYDLGAHDGAADADTRWIAVIRDQIDALPRTSITRRNTLGGLIGEVPVTRRKKSNCELVELQEKPGKS